MEQAIRLAETTATSISSIKEAYVRSSKSLWFVEDDFISRKLLCQGLWFVEALQAGVRQGLWFVEALLCHISDKIWAIIGRFSHAEQRASWFCHYNNRPLHSVFDLSTGRWRSICWICKIQCYRRILDQFIWKWRRSWLIQAC